MQNQLNLQHCGKSMPIILTQKSEIVVAEYKCTLCKGRFLSKSKFHEHHIGNTGCKLKSCMSCVNVEDKEANGVKDIRVNKFCKDEDITDEEEEDEEQEETSAIMVYKCTICDKQCNSKRSLYQHNGTHYGNKPYGCEYCDYRSTLRGIMKNHLQIRHGRKIKCTLIIPDKKNKTFIRAYRCVTCKKTVATKECLQKHLLMNKECNRFKCMFCDYRGMFKSTLKIHVRGKHGRNMESPESHLDTADSIDKIELKTEVEEYRITSEVVIKQETIKDTLLCCEENDFNTTGAKLVREEEQVIIKQELTDHSENCDSRNIYDTNKIQVKCEFENLDYPQQYNQIDNDYIQTDKLNIKTENFDANEIRSHPEEPVFHLMYDNVNVRT